LALARMACGRVASGEDHMNWFRKREAKTAPVPMVSVSDLQQAQWSGADAMVREGFERNAVGYRCVRMVAEAAASIGFAARASDGRDALALLLARPNRDQAGPDLMEMFYIHLLISGDAYLEALQVDGAVRELHVLRPDRMRAVKGPRGWPVAWEHRAGSEARRIGREADGFMPVLHLRLYHPGDDYEGHAPLEAAARAVDVHNGGGAWAKALIDNAARPSGALIYSGADQMTEEQVDDIRRQLDDMHQGPRNAGRPIILSGGLDWKPMSLSPAELDFVEARSQAAREIALAFGVPPMLLGMPGDNTYANYREANLAFWRTTVLPLVGRAARGISNWLGDRLGGEVRPDLEGVPALQEDRAAQWERIGRADFLTLEEKRKAAGLV
jgi:HK97 family phage portal protein